MPRLPHTAPPPPTQQLPPYNEGSWAANHTQGPALPKAPKIPYTTPQTRLLGLPGSARPSHRWARVGLLPPLPPRLGLL